MLRVKTNTTEEGTVKKPEGVSHKKQSARRRVSTFSEKKQGGTAKSLSPLSQKKGFSRDYEFWFSARAVLYRYF